MDNDYNDQMVEDLKKQRKTNTRNFVRAIDPKLLIAVGAIVLFGAWAVSSEIFTWKQLAWIVAIAVIIILIIAYNALSKTIFLTYEQAFALARDHLLERQRMLIDVPIGELDPIGYGRLIKVNNEPSYWTFGFIILGADSFEHVFEVLVDAKADGLGVIGRIPRQQSGYNPMDRKDVFLQQFDQTANAKFGNLPPRV